MAKVQITLISWARLKSEIKFFVLLMNMILFVSCSGKPVPETRFQVQTDSLEDQNIKTENHQLKKKNEELESRFQKLEEQLNEIEEKFTSQISLMDQTINLLEESVLEQEQIFESQKEILAMRTMKLEIMSENSVKKPIAISTPPESKAIKPTKLKPKRQSDPSIPSTEQKPKSLKIAAAIPLQKSPTSTKSMFEDKDLTVSNYPLELNPVAGAKRFYNLAYKSYSKKDYSSAIQQFTDFIKKFPSDLDADNSQFWIGLSHWNMNKLTIAEKAFRKVLKNYIHGYTARGYKTPDAILMLGRIYQKKGKSLRANYYYKKVAELYPESRSAEKAKLQLSSSGFH